MALSYRTLTVLFALCTILLWCLINYLLICDPELDLDTRRTGVENSQGAAPTPEFDAAEWLRSNLPSFFVAPESSCDPARGNAATFAMMMAVGELGGMVGQEGRAERASVGRALSGIATLRGAADLIVTSLGSRLSLDDTTSDLLRDLRSLGFGLLSLASVQSKLYDNSEMQRVLELMEAANIKWVGWSQHSTDLQSRIVELNGQKVGFLAFCSTRRQCEDSRDRPLGPTRYDHKQASYVISQLKMVGVASVVAIVYWGYRHSYFPDESQLVIARQLAELDVTLVIGYHPQLVQDHAYFGNTLILFSIGTLLTSDRDDTTFCSNIKSSAAGVQENLSDGDPCQVVHPGMCNVLLSRQHITRAYRIGLTRSGTAVAEYTDIPLIKDTDSTHVHKPEFNRSTQWTAVCSHLDTNCLSCHPL